MNKDFLNSLPTDDQPVASILNLLVDDVQLSQTFQWKLETKLMDAAKNKQEFARSWRSKILPAFSWTVIAIAAVLLLNWTVRSLSSPPPAAAVTPGPIPSFEADIQQRRICAAPLAVGHGFAVFLSDDKKTGFLPLDQEKMIGEMRSFAWSADGSQLALFGNTTGHGNIWLTDSSGSPVQPVLLHPELGYLMDGARSRDGKQFLLWSSQNNKVIYLLDADGSDMIEKQLGLRIMGTPQYAPDGKSVVFYGADLNAAGLFELKLDSSQVTLINPSVKDPSGYAFSPDGSLLAYLEYDRDEGEARLLTTNLATGEVAILGKMTIPRNPGASLPDSSNLSWSADGNFLVFDFGQYASERSIYLAPVDGSGLIKIVDRGYAPSISGDGNCLAYISDKQVFLLDLRGAPSISTTGTPLLLAELPAGRGTPNAKQDKLQWQP